MKDVLILYTQRDTYGKNESAERTMTAGQLREFLDNYNDDTPVLLAFDGGYTYGYIKESRFEEDTITPED